MREQESGRSTESNEPANPDGLTTREGLNLAGRTRPSMVLTRSNEADRLSIWAAIIVAEKEWLLRPQGLPGTAVRGPACTVVWEAGGATLPPTRLGRFSVWTKLSMQTKLRHKSRSGNPTNKPNDVAAEEVQARR